MSGPVRASEFPAAKPVDLDAVQRAASARAEVVAAGEALRVAQQVAKAAQQRLSDAVKAYDVAWRALADEHERSSDGRICDACGCTTNSRIRTCCERGHAADVV